MLERAPELVLALRLRLRCLGKHMKKGERRVVKVSAEERVAVEAFAEHCQGQLEPRWNLSASLENLHTVGVYSLSTHRKNLDLRGQRRRCLDWNCVVQVVQVV